MNELFGIPMSVLSVVLPAAFVAVLVFVAFLALRQPVLFRLSARYVARRAGRAALIVTGLMLATAIIAAALTTGDTMRHTIRSEVLTGLGNIDEVISTQEESDIEATGESARSCGTCRRAISRRCGRAHWRLAWWTGWRRLSARRSASRTSALAETSRGSSWPRWTPRTWTGSGRSGT